MRLRGWSHAAAIFNFRKKVSITPDWIKISAPTFTGRRIKAMQRWPRDQKLKPEVNSLYQAGGRGRSRLFPVSHLLISLPSEGQSLWANEISSTYLNWRLRYNYFRFWQTNVRHIGNLLSVSISTICPKSAHYSASGYRTLSKSKHPLREYDVISIS